MAWTTKSSLPQALAERLEDRVDRGAVLDVARQHQRCADLVGQRLDAPAERFALIGEGELGAVLGEFLRDAPGDRMIVGDAHDKAALALHQSVHAAIPHAGVALEDERRVGAAEAERIGQHRVDPGVVDALAHDRHAFEFGIERLRYGRFRR